MPFRTPVIIGPTAGGKSALAMELARLRGGEIVTADAFQVYRGMDIGTAKPTAAERAMVPHHVLDVVEPTERFTASDWLTAANAAMADVRARGAMPIVVGGTHLYIKLLLDGMFEGPAADGRLRAELAAIPSQELRAQLERDDPISASRLHPNDLRRTIRALEVFRLTGKPISEHQTQWGEMREPDDFLVVTLDWPSEAINPRINARVKAMVNAGLVEEVRGLWSSGRLGPQAREALGYKQLVDHFERRCGLDDALERIKIETRHFAKNQRTWLRRLRARPGTVVVEGPTQDPVNVVGKIEAAMARGGAR